MPKQHQAQSQARWLADLIWPIADDCLRGKRRTEEDADVST
ncbi:MAG: hypothetical protein Q4A98_09585 [Comamonadaceae bacterium]|nr:hypothetical protein [Comamonadaceae bacterium]